MHAKVLLLRKMGVLLPRGPRPPEDTWPSGILEVSNHGHFSKPPGRRLLLRDVRSCPSMGISMELFQPKLLEAPSGYLRFRGIEAVTTANNEIAGVVQEWLVRVTG